MGIDFNGSERGFFTDFNNKKKFIFTLTIGYYVKYMITALFIYMFTLIRHCGNRLQHLLIYSLDKIL